MGSRGRAQAQPRVASHELTQAGGMMPHQPDTSYLQPFPASSPYAGGTGGQRGPQDLGARHFYLVHVLTFGVECTGGSGPRVCPINRRGWICFSG